MTEPPDWPDPAPHRRTMREPLVYTPAARPDVEVEVDGQWHPGELRAWFPRPDGTSVGNVQDSPAPVENRLDTFPERRIRQVSAPS